MTTGLAIDGNRSNSHGTRGLVVSRSQLAMNGAPPKSRFQHRLRHDSRQNVRLEPRRGPGESRVQGGGRQRSKERAWAGTRGGMGHGKSLPERESGFEMQRWMEPMLAKERVPTQGGMEGGRKGGRWSKGGRQGRKKGRSVAIANRGGISPHSIGGENVFRGVIGSQLVL